MEIKNKIALVTGGSKGIGGACALALAKEGCSVIINYCTDEQGAYDIMTQCNTYSQGNMIVKTDISKENEVIDMMHMIAKKYPALHILINNVGIFDEQDNPNNIAVFEKLFYQNFLSHVIVTSHALKLLKHGKIINISSIHGHLGYGRPSGIAYASLKAALDNYTKNLAKQVAPDILVNAIAPGRVLTPMWGKLTIEEEKELGAVHLINRMIRPEEIAEAAVFLVKNDAMCAEILTIDGGYRLASLT